MKYTLLDLTQTILSSLDSDEINSINDSVESQQVAKIIRTAYFDILTRANIPATYSLITLDASGDSSKPTLMTLPATVNKIMWVKYNKATVDDTRINMEYIQFKPLDEFLSMMHMLDTDADNVDTFTHTVGPDTFTIMYYTDRSPTYYTTFDDFTFIFDGYDSAVDTTLQKNKTLVYGENVIPFTMSDTFTPDLNEPQFALLLNEAKSLAWAELKQTQHAKAEVNSRREWVSMQRTKNALEKESDFNRLPHFGRK